MIVLAIDPGPTESAFILFRNDPEPDIGEYGKVSNETLLARIEAETERPAWRCAAMAIEQVASFGMPVGAEVFETVFWSGRFAQAWGKQLCRIKRHEVKMHLCKNMRAKDGNIRQALIDKFGPPGKKRNPGTLYGVSGDVWSALAVAVTFLEARPDLEPAHLIGVEEEGND